MQYARALRVLASKGTRTSGAHERHSLVGIIGELVNLRPSSTHVRVVANGSCEA